MFLKQRSDEQCQVDLNKTKGNKRRIPKFIQGLIAILLGLLLAVLCSFATKALQPLVSSIQPGYWQKFLSNKTSYKRYK